MLQLEFNREHKSIQSLIAPLELPDLSILTGQNGSGKSHILEAIKGMNILASVDGEPVSEDEIIRIEFGELSTTGNDSYSSQDAQQMCNNLWENFSNYRNSYDRRTAGLDFQIYIQRWRNNDPGTNRIINGIEAVLRSEPGIDIARITKQHFWTHIFDPESATAGVDFFEQNFARLFAEYQVSLIKQRFYLYMEENGYGNAPAINKDNLKRLEANQPWDFVNEVLKTANFDFRMLPPDFWDTEEFSYKIKLKKLSSGANVEFNDLSTGEKVLFALALVRYKAERRSKVFPKLILLDEPDAPLHPAMSKTMIEVLKDVFVKEYKTSVLMTTHSPATVALAPIDSVFTVTTESRPNVTIISPASQQEALETLASGFVAISSEENQTRITFEAERTTGSLLYVEGTSDEHILRTAWKKLYTGEAFPYDVVPTGSHKEINKKIDAVSVAELKDRKVVALMDFDEAFQSFNGLERYEPITQDQRGCYQRVRKNGRNTVIAILIPVPMHRSNYASLSLGDKSALSIELMFSDEALEKKKNLDDRILPGAAAIKVFKGNKSRFATKTINSFSRDEFEAFRPLLETLRALS